jgi:hypothetical protein
MSKTNVHVIKTQPNTLFDTKLSQESLSKIQHDYTTTIKEVNEILKKYLHPSQKSDNYKFKWIAVLTIIVFIGCLLLFLAPVLPYSYYMLYERDQQLFYKILGGQCVFLLVAIAVDVYLLSSAKTKMVKVKDEVAIRVDDVLKKHNKEKYVGQGISWEFDWEPNITGIREDVEPCIRIFYTS